MLTRPIDRLIALLALAAWLGGCASVGTDFRPPAQAGFVLGETTRMEVVGRYGPPHREGSETRTLAAEKSGDAGEQGLAAWVSYLFIPDRSMQNGVLKRKTASFTFWNRRLVSYRYSSTFPNDSSNFDASRLEQVVRNRTTRSEATKLFGEPTGMSIYPATGSRSLRFLVYYYVEFDRDKKVRFTKQLTLHLDQSDVIVDYRFESRTDPYNPPSPRYIPVPIPIFVR